MARLLSMATIVSFSRGLFHVLASSAASIARSSPVVESGAADIGISLLIIAHSSLPHTTAMPHFVTVLPLTGFVSCRVTLSGHVRKQNRGSAGKDMRPPWLHPIRSSSSYVLSLNLPVGFTA